jgi:hypothetical protein
MQCCSVWFILFHRIQILPELGPLSILDLLFISWKPEVDQSQFFNGHSAKFLKVFGGSLFRPNVSDPLVSLDGHIKRLPFLEA